MSIQVVDEFSTIHETSLSATKALVRWYPLELICEDQENTTKVKASLKADITMWALTVLEVRVIPKGGHHIAILTLSSSS